MTTETLDDYVISGRFLAGLWAVAMWIVLMWGTVELVANWSRWIAVFTLILAAIVYGATVATMAMLAVQMQEDY